MRWLGAVTAALEHGPERLYVIDVNLVFNFNVLTDAMPHRAVIMQTFAGLQITGEDFGALRDPIMAKP